MNFQVERAFFICLILVQMPGCSQIHQNEAKDEAKKEKESPLKASPEEMKWFRDAKFGMFIHWGPVSLTGKELSWSRTGPRPFDHQSVGIAMTPQEEYDQLYKRFNPVNYNPDEWVSLAKDAGMKYMVFTTKHHDGFSNFHTRHSDYNISNAPYQKDLVAKLAKACHRGGMKLGFYYSQRDWYHPDYLADSHENYLKFMFGQIRELLGNYGKVDIMWFDSIARDLQSWPCEELIRLVRRQQPGIIINNRAASVLGDYTGAPEHLQCDFGTPEHQIGGFEADGVWESCITLTGHQWSYKSGGEMMTLKECIDALVRCVGGNGNLLLNVGPMPDGRIEPRQAERLREIGRWIDKYNESVYGTRGGPFLPGDWGGSANRGNVVYLHVLKWPEGALKLAPLEYKIRSARNLSGGDVEFTQTSSGITVNVPKAQRDPLCTVIRLEIDGTIPEDYAPSGLK